MKFILSEDSKESIKNFKEKFGGQEYRRFNKYKSFLEKVNVPSNLDYYTHQSTPAQLEELLDKVESKINEPKPDKPSVKHFIPRGNNHYYTVYRIQRLLSHPETICDELQNLSGDEDFAEYTAEVITMTEDPLPKLSYLAVPNYLNDPYLIFSLNSVEDSVYMYINIKYAYEEGAWDSITSSEENDIKKRFLPNIIDGLMIAETSKFNSGPLTVHGATIRRSGDKIYVKLLEEFDGTLYIPCNPSRNNSIFTPKIPIDGSNIIFSGAGDEERIINLVLEGDIPKVPIVEYRQFKNLESFIIDNKNEKNPYPDLSIGGGAFAGLTKLKTIKLLYDYDYNTDKAVRRKEDANFSFSDIGSEAFMSANLESIGSNGSSGSIYISLSSDGIIGDKAFANSNISNVIIYGGTEYAIRPYAFQKCKNLTDIRVSEPLYLPKGVFDGCENLKWIFINSCSKIAKDAFTGGSKNKLCLNAEKHSSENTCAFLDDGAFDDFEYIDFFGGSDVETKEYIENYRKEHGFKNWKIELT